MKIAFILFNGFTLLDFAGIFDPITRLKTMGFLTDLEYSVCSQENIVHSFEGTEITVDCTGCDLSSFDWVIIPGGNGIQEIIRDPGFIAWLITVSDSAGIAAVCGGALLAGAAGFLKGKTATTHPDLIPVLKMFSQGTSMDRIVEDGRIITAGGVTSSIDLGLYLCEKIAGKDVREKIQKQMDYPYYNQDPSAP
jgi:cyclohexyl-isocyanide hydratase